MNGRVEKESKAVQIMEKKLSKLPEIFTSFYNWMDAREKSYTTMNNYINHTVEFKEFCDKISKKIFYQNVTDDVIEKYMNSLRRKTIKGEKVEVGDEIRAAKWSSLNTFFKFLYQKKYIEANPMLLTERPRVRTQHSVTYMNFDEIQTVYQRIVSESREMNRNRDMCILSMGLGTGLRVSAIVNINIEDIDFTTNTVKVIEKGRKTRHIRFAENLKNLLKDWIKDREMFFCGGQTGPLFLSQNKSRISVTAVENMVKKYTSHLNKKITPHKLRSSAAMNLHGAGVDILTIASILGHENITTTQRYTRAYDQDQKAATNILDNLLR